MRLVINGEERQIDDVVTVLDLLQQFRIDQKILVVEVNREIIDKARYTATALQEHDRIEIVHFVGGG